MMGPEVQDKDSITSKLTTSQNTKDFLKSLEGDLAIAKASLSCIHASGVRATNNMQFATKYYALITHPHCYNPVTWGYVQCKAQALRMMAEQLQQFPDYQRRAAEIVSKIESMLAIGKYVLTEQTHYETNPEPGGNIGYGDISAGLHHINEIWGEALPETKELRKLIDKAKGEVVQFRIRFNVTFCGGGEAQVSFDANSFHPNDGRCEITGNCSEEMAEIIRQLVRERQDWSAYWSVAKDVRFVCE